MSDETHAEHHFATGGPIPSDVIHVPVESPPPYIISKEYVGRIGQAFTANMRLMIDSTDE